MRDYINIGSSPAGESCAQVGEDDYPTKSRRECRAYINQLRRQFGPEPKGASLGIKSFEHDFGTYREVVCHYDDGDGPAIDYALRVEAGSPEEWDEAARIELKGGPTFGLYSSTGESAIRNIRSRE